MELPPALRCNSYVRKLLLVAAGALVIAPDATAKLCASVAIRPMHTVVGQRVQVRLTTWMPEWVGGRAHFGHYVSLPSRYQLRVDATPPRKASFSVNLRRDVTRPWLWRGWLTVREPGLWTVAPDHIRWGFAPRSCARTVRFVVS